MAGFRAQGAFESFGRFVTHTSTTVGGEPQDAQFPGTSGWIKITLTDQGSTNLLNIGSQSSGAGAGVAHFTAFDFTKAIDLATPVFFKMLAAGTPFDTVDIAFRQTGVSGNHPAPFYTATLKLAAFNLTINPVTPALFATPDLVTRVFGSSNAIPIATLLSNDSTGAVFDSLPSSNTTLNGRVTLQGTSILYQPPIPDPGLDDTFTYRIHDAFGQMAIGAVTVGVSLPGGGSTGNLSIQICSQRIELQLACLPARKYQLQTALSVNGPWTNLGTPFLANANGTTDWVDSTHQTQVFYRAFNIP